MVTLNVKKRDKNSRRAMADLHVVFGYVLSSNKPASKILFHAYSLPQFNE